MRLPFKGSPIRDAAIALILLCAAGVWFVIGSTSSPGPRPGGLGKGDARPFIQALMDPALGLEARHRMLPGIMEFGEYRTPPGALATSSVPQFLEHQVLAKVARTEAEFRLLEGRRAEAMQQLAAVYIMGQLMSESEMGIASMIGVAIKAIALGGFGHAVLNLSETTDSRQLVWETLTDVEARTSPPVRSDQLKDLTWWQRFVVREAIDEFFIRHQTVYAQLQLLRAAAASLDRLATAGGFPRTAADFAPLLPAGPPDDPFRKPAGALKFNSTGKDFVLWSVGPDGVNQGGTLQYDPTNGTMSAGDIIMEVAHDRRFPFPTSGTAATMTDVRTRFSRGLPVDIFADLRGLGYTVATTGTAAVYSFGPDTDQARHGAAAGTPEVRYDPTNGMISDGDLVLTLPE